MESLTSQQVVILLLTIVWSSVWKGFALWKAAGQKDTAWFIALFVLNTLGLLEMFYIFIFSKRNRTKSDNGDIQ